MAWIIRKVSQLRKEMQDGLVKKAPLKFIYEEKAML